MFFKILFNNRYYKYYLISHINSFFQYFFYNYH